MATVITSTVLQQAAQKAAGDRPHALMARDPDYIVYLLRAAEQIVARLEVLEQHAGITPTA